MALTIEERVAVLETKASGPVDPPPYIEPVVATVTTGDKTITATSGTKADLVALVDAKIKE